MLYVFRVVDLTNWSRISESQRNKTKLIPINFIALVRPFCITNRFDGVEINRNKNQNFISARLNRYIYSWIFDSNGCTIANPTVFLAFYWWMVMNENFNVIDSFFQLFCNRCVPCSILLLTRTALTILMQSHMEHHLFWWFFSSHHLISFVKKMQHVPFILHQPYLKAKCIRLDLKLFGGTYAIYFQTNRTHICESSSLH